MNTQPIDIIVPWVNPNDDIWKKEFNFWKEKETGVKDACRYRDWGFLKYVFRSIEKNCPWCRFVFLVLESESQIPDWLDTSCPKLKIVYHKDYIPQEFLPTFNSNVIELFYSNIKELSENFILINDDMYFTQKKSEDFFFVNDKPVYYKVFKTFKKSKIWDKTLINSRNKANELLKMKTNQMYSTNHLPIGYNKSLQQFILSKINLNFMKNNKFRKNNDLTHFLFYDVQCKIKKCTFNNTKRGIYMGINRSTKYKFNFPMCCINENELSKPDDCKKALKEINKIFNKKSIFEK